MVWLVLPQKEHNFPKLVWFLLFLPFTNFLLPLGGAPWPMLMARILFSSLCSLISCLSCCTMRLKTRLIERRGSMRRICDLTPENWSFNPLRNRITQSCSLYSLHTHCKPQAQGPIGLLLSISPHSFFNCVKKLMTERLHVWGYKAPLEDQLIDNGCLEKIVASIQTKDRMPF